MAKKSKKSHQRRAHRSARSLMYDAITHPRGEFPMGTLPGDLHALMRRGWAAPTSDGSGWRITETGRTAHHTHANHISK